MTRRMNRCGQTEAAHCVVALKLKSLCLSSDFSLAVNGAEGKLRQRHFHVTHISMW